MPETIIPVTERRYELLRDICLPNRYIPAGRVGTGAEWAEKGLINVGGSPDSVWFRDLTPSPATTYSDVDKLYIFCRDILSDQGLCSIAYIQAAVRCVELDRANRSYNPKP